LPVPTALIYANVFGASHRSLRDAGQREVMLVDTPTLRMRFRGPVLRQAHADLLGVALRHVSGGAEGSRFSMPVAEVLRQLGRHNGALKRRELAQLVDDLAASRLSVHGAGDEDWVGSQLILGHYGTRRGVLFFGVDMPLLELLGLGVTAVDAAQRCALGDRPLAKWLQLYLELDESKAPRTVGEVRQRAAPGQPLFAVRRRSSAALRELEAVGGPRHELVRDELVRR
jgi:hypothetical protein